jgi:hypothetical protein
MFSVSLEWFSIAVCCCISFLTNIHFAEHIVHSVVVTFSTLILRPPVQITASAKAAP